MAYVRKKRAARGTDYYQLVESRRVDGKPRQRVLMHLGRNATVEQALKWWPKDIGLLKRRGYKEAACELAEKLGRLRTFDKTGVVPDNGAVD